MRCPLRRGRWHGYRLPGKELGAYPHHQPGRIDLHHGLAENPAEPELRFPTHDPGDGLEAASERREALEAHQGVQKAGTGREQRPVSGWRAVGRSG